jgi:DNA-directed RNA polymerase II subunit RPB2
MEVEDQMLTPADSWQVITSFFQEKGMVGQQLESFDEFINTTIQELVDDMRKIVVAPTGTYNPDTQKVEERRYTIEFGELKIGKPTVREVDGKTSMLYPHEARLRNLTYHAPLYCNIKVTTEKRDGDEEKFVPFDDPDTKVDSEINQDTKETGVVVSREFLGFMPIMLRSKRCLLSTMSEHELGTVNECVYDEGGYFVINGSEKVIIAQERQANNNVYCFEKKGGRFAFSSELRSHLEKGSRPPSPVQCLMFAGSSNKMTNAINQIHVMLPYIKSTIPVVCVFRALGVASDREIVERVCYHADDFEMMEKFKPSLEEGFEFQDEEDALDFLGKRGTLMSATRAERIEYARGLLASEVFPHIGVTAASNEKKAFFLGYMVHRLLLISLGRGLWGFVL